MPLPSLNGQRLMISTGSFPSSKIQNLAASHPFTQQEGPQTPSLDVLFPSSSILTSNLESLHLQYSRGKFGLAEFLEEAEALVDSGASLSALNLWANGTIDTWCIQRGLLTLCVSKETYEQLGLVGSKLPFKGCPNLHVIHIPLGKNTASITNRAKARASLQSWDIKRGKDGLGKWNVLYCSTTTGSGHPMEGHETCQAKCQRRETQSIIIPTPSISPRPSASEDDLADWEENMWGLFEWVGMATIGSQRLNVNDRVNPYVAVYDPPSKSEVGNITHLRWTGFMTPGFIQSIIDAITLFLSDNINSTMPFVCMTVHGFTSSPVSYIRPSALTGDTSNSTQSESPFKVPTTDGEDSLSLIFVGEQIGKRTKEAGRWAMVESIGKWDARFG